MSELQLERLTNLVANPYTWMGIVTIFSLIFILPYIRRFYPKSWQEAMVKEEACNLEHHKKSEMKLVRKIINIGFLSMLLISYILSFHLLSDLVNPLKTFRDIFLGGMLLIMVVSVYYESKIKKDKQCKNVIAGYKFIKIVGIIVVIFIIIIFILYLVGYIK